MPAHAFTWGDLSQATVTRQDYANKDAIAGKTLTITRIVRGEYRKRARWEITTSLGLVTLGVATSAKGLAAARDAMLEAASAALAAGDTLPKAKLVRNEDRFRTWLLLPA
jgi:hypothetical protein